MAAYRMRWRVFLLATAQALFQTASVLVMTVGGLAGSQIATRPDLATAPIASMFLGTAVSTFPASAWMAKVGRRSGFVVGALLGSIGGVTAALGIWLHTLPLLAFGTFLIGSYQRLHSPQIGRIAQRPDETFRPRAISLVLAGGIVAALLGPWLSRLGGPLLEPQYVGSFLLLSLVSLLGAGAMPFCWLPWPPSRPAPPPHPSDARPQSIARGKRHLDRLIEFLVAFSTVVLLATPAHDSPIPRLCRRSIEEPVDLGRQDEIVLVQPFDLLRPQRNRHVPPSEGDIGVVTFAFGELTNLLHEAQCFAEIPELEGPLDPLGIVAQLPLRDLLMKAFSLLGRERRETPLTGSARFPNKCVSHTHLPAALSLASSPQNARRSGGCHALVL